MCLLLFLEGTFLFARIAARQGPPLSSLRKHELGSRNYDGTMYIYTHTRYTHAHKICSRNQAPPLNLSVQRCVNFTVVSLSQITFYIYKMKHFNESQVSISFRTGGAVLSRLSLFHTRKKSKASLSYTKNDTFCTFNELRVKTFVKLQGLLLLLHVLTKSARSPIQWKYKYGM